MEQTVINREKTNKYFWIIMILFCALPVFLDTLLITPIYVSLENNVAFSESFLTMVIYYFKDILGVVAFSVAYAIIIFSILLLSKRKARLAVLLYTVIYFLQIPLKLIMNIPLYGSLGSVDDITLDVIYLTVYFLLYMLQLLIVWLFATTDTNKYLRYIAFVKEKKNKKGKSLPAEPDAVLPLTKFFNRYNPLQRSAFKMSLLILAVKLLSRVINDISYGAPSSIGEVLVMAAYYLSDILFALVAYVIALLVFSVLHTKAANKKADGTSAPSASEGSTAE